MGIVVVSSAATSFPATGSNRTRVTLVRDIARAGGGENDSDLDARAEQALGDAIREYNGVRWEFNLKSTDITLVAGTQSYALSAGSSDASDFIVPYRAMILDVNGKMAGYEPLQFIRYDEWLDFSGNETSRGSPPAYYTVQNVHRDGLIYYDPIPSGAAAFPKVRHFYFCDIAQLTSDGAVLNVPSNIERGIIELATAYYVRMTQGASQAAPILQRADILRLELEQYGRRRFPDR